MPGQSLDNSMETLKIGTLNIQNSETNIQYLQEILPQHDILCLQEHWLLSCDKDSLETINNDYEVISLSADDNQPRLDYKLIRGYGGTAIFWKKALNGKIKHLISVTPRIIAIEIKINPYPICLINAYMPSDTKNSDIEYKDTLVQIHEIINTYGCTHEMILCGDMNASLIRQNTRDKTLHSFLQENQLTTTEKYPNKSTFFHHNQKYVSQIDYFFFKANSGLKIQNIVIRDHEATNLSDHTLLTVNIKTPNLPKGSKTAKTKTITTKPKWEKAEVDIYREEIKDAIPKLISTQHTLEEKINTLTEILHEAGSKSIPNYREKKNVKTRGKSIWNREIGKTSKECKALYEKWKKSGKINTDLKKQISKHKKQLRRLQRQAIARCANKNITEIMEAHKGDSKTFHKLIRNQRKAANRNTNILEIEGKEISEPIDILNAWQSHFKGLATPFSKPNLDDSSISKVELASLQNAIIEEQEIHNPETLPSVSKEEVIKAIGGLNIGKSPDIAGLSAENLILAKEELAEPIADIINSIFTKLDTPDVMKRGILTPVHKKGKSKLHTGNYRGIVVTSVVSKVLESILKDKIDNIFQPMQNKLQRGFTNNSSSMNAAFIITETIQWHKTMKIPLFLTTLDAQKAFDRVNHEILFNKLFHMGVHGHLWILLRNLYRNISLQVKWDNELSECFSLEQGTMQGAKLSTTLYKIYHNSLLDVIEHSNLGANIGQIRVPAPTCADDTALLATNQHELQHMLNIVDSLTKRDLVTINPEKTEIIKYGTKIQVKVSLDGKDINEVNNTKHLGIVRYSSNKIETDKRVKTGLQTMYAMFGPGMQARRGLSPIVSLHTWTIYAIPRSLYGIEVLNTTAHDLLQLERMQRKVLKHIQGLPDRTATLAVYVLIGAEPIETILDRNVLTLFINISRLQGTRENDILHQQIKYGNQTKGALLDKVNQSLYKLDLPTAEKLFHNPPNKHSWSKLVKKAVCSYWRDQWQEEKSTKSSLKYLQIQQVPIGNPHNLWKSIKLNQHEVRSAETKARILTGTYTLQINAAKYNGTQTSAECQLCHKEDEDLEHFILRCADLQICRTQPLLSLERICNTARPSSYLQLQTEGLLLQMILDCTHTDIEQLVRLNKKLQIDVERLSHQLVQKLHLRRTLILNERAHLKISGNKSV